MDETLPLHHRLAIRMHLTMCRYCARFRRQLMMLRKASRQEDSGKLPHDITGCLSQDARERIKESLRAKP
jgi:hypothetical protein